jgi:trans-2,3-dihydro-3-hydroxyanthranilate isomerase
VTPLELAQASPRPTPAPQLHRRIGIKQVDAFTETPLAGNPAGVVVNAAGLTDQQMQLVAREVAVSETAFILPPTTPAAHLRIRWFTPQTEVPLCGHATVAGFHALAEEGLAGMKQPGRYAFTLETKSGNLPVSVEKTAHGAEVFLGLPVPEFIRAGQHKLDVMRILNISIDEFENRMPIMMTDSLFVPIRRLHTLFSMKPNFFSMVQFLKTRNLQGICVFTTETVDRRSAVHSRYFAPGVGIDEDPVTGSANGPVGVYLYDHGVLERGAGSLTIVGEQGDVIGRRGRVTIELHAQGGKVTAVKVGGRAVTIFSGEMLIP